MSQVASQASIRSLSTILGSEGKSLREVEEEVDRSVQGLEEALHSIGLIINERKPQEADLLTGVGILHSHIKTVSHLMEEVHIMLREKQQEEMELRTNSHFFYYANMAEVGLDVVSVSLNIINNVMKTADLSATSPVGWVSVSLNAVSTIFSKIIDRSHADELTRQKTKTKLHKMVARLSVVERAHTMAKLFKLFELIRRGEKIAEPHLLASGIKECQRIPESLQKLVNPEGMVMQLLAVSNVDVSSLNTSTNLGRTVVRAIEHHQSSMVKEAALEEVVEVAELVRRWEDATYQIKTTLYGVDNVLLERLERPGHLHFTPVITILNNQIKKLRDVGRHVDEMIQVEDKKPSCCSYRNRFFVLSVMETALTVGAVASFIFFNLLQAESVILVWVSGMVMLLGPVVSRVNKFAIQKVIEKEIDRQQLIKIREGQSFIESSETFVLTLQAIQDAQEHFAPDQLAELLEVCRTSGFVKDYISEDVMRGVVTSQVKAAVATDAVATRYITAMETRAYRDRDRRKLSRESKMDDATPSPQGRGGKRKGTLEMPEEKIELTLLREFPPAMKSRPRGDLDELSDFVESDDEEGSVGSREVMPPCFKRQSSDHIRNSKDELLAQFAEQVAHVAHRESPDTPQKYLKSMIGVSNSVDSNDGIIRGDDLV